MPLARIFTQHPERTTSLCEELKQQGYQVEVRSPDEIHLTPADLEIEFEICDRADVLKRAASLADELQADVAVAPGVLQAAEQTTMEAIPATIAEPVAAAVPVDATGPEPDREREFEAAFASSAEELPVEETLPPPLESPVTEHAPLPPVALMDEPDAMRAGPPASPIQEATARAADPVPYLAQLTPFGTPADHEYNEESVRRLNDPELRHGRPEVVQDRAGAPESNKPAEGFFSKVLAEVKSVSATAAESFRGRLEEYRKRAQVRLAEAQAARVARMLDLEQRKAEAQQRAAELEAAREAASARLLQLIRERDPGFAKEEPAEERRPLQPQRPIESLRHASIASMQKRPRRPMSPQLRAVLTGAAAVTVFIVIGIVLGELHPRTPLANPGSQASGGVTVQTGVPATETGGVTVKTGAPAQPAPVPQASASAAQTPAQTKPSPRSSPARRLVQQDEQIGDDVVVRHYSRPVIAQKTKPAGQQAGLKHFSDLDN